MMSKDESILLKGIAITLMLTFHLWNPLDLYPFEDETIGLLHREWAAFGSICVSLFVFLSGYGLEASKSCNNIHSLWKRIQKLYFNYWKVWVPCAATVLMIDGIHFRWYNYGLEMLGLKSYLDGVVWFIYLYVELVLFKYVINKVTSKNTPPSAYLFLLIISLVVGLLYSTQVTNKYLTSTYISRFLEYVPCFISGIYCKRSGCVDKRLKSQLFTILSLCVLIVFRIWIYFHTELYIKKYLDAIIVPAFICLCLSVKRPEYINDLLMHLGRKSMDIWIVHGFYYIAFSKFVLFPKVSVLILIWLVITAYAISLVIERLWGLLDTIYTKLKK